MIGDSNIGIDPPPVHVNGKVIFELSTNHSDKFIELINILCHFCDNYDIQLTI